MKPKLNQLLGCCPPLRSKLPRRTPRCRHWRGKLRCRAFQVDGDGIDGNDDHVVLALASLVPQPTCCWKWVGGSKGVKRAFLSLAAIFSAKNGPKLKNLTFLESAVREFSENGFGSKKN